MPELIELFSRFEDYNSGDGVYTLRSEITKTLGRIGRAEAIEPMISMLVEKSLSPDKKGRASIHWHDVEYENFRSYLKRGTGPQAIMMGLMQMPPEHHSEILIQLREARVQIDQSELFNVWSKFEIDRGICFFEADEKTRNRIRNSVAGSWSLDHVEFEKLSDPEYVKPWAKCRVRLSNGEWSEEIASEKELKAILSENRKASAKRRRAVAD